MEHHARRPVAKKHPEGCPQRSVATTVTVSLLRLAEYRGVQPHRPTLEEDLPLCLPDVDGAHLAGGDNRGRTLQIARDVEHTCHVHHAAERQDAKRGLFSKHLAGDGADGAVSAGGNDDVVALGYRIAGGSDRL